MPDKMTTLKLTVNAGQGIDAEEVMELTRQLKDELLETDVDSVDFAKADVLPEGSRTGDATSINSLLIACVASGSVLPTLISAVQAWATRDKKRSITAEDKRGNHITITGHNSEEEKQLLKEWIEKQKGL